jgi:hypothetical protein
MADNTTNWSDSAWDGRDWSQNQYDINPWATAGENQWGKSSESYNRFSHPVTANTTMAEPVAAEAISASAEPKIINAYWASDTNGTPVSVVDFNEDVHAPIVWALVQTKNMRWRSLDVILYSSDNAEGYPLLNKSGLVPNNDWLFIAFSSDELFSGWDKYSITVKDTDTQDVMYRSKHVLHLNPVKAVPYIMREKVKEHQDWILGLMFQNRWFEGPATIAPSQVQSFVDDFSLDWALTYSRADRTYKDALNPDKKGATGYWFNDACKKEIEKRILNLHSSGKIQLPANIDDTIEYGTFSKSIERQNEQGYYVPEFDYFYCQTRSCVLSPSIELLLDGFTGLDVSLGTFTFRFSPKGVITKTGEKAYKFYIIEVGIYIRDSFDFQDIRGAGNIDLGFDYKLDSEDSQWLGVWNPKTKYVGADANMGYWVNNRRYRDYQQRTELGQNFIVYSNVKVIPVNLEVAFTA